MRNWIEHFELATVIGFIHVELATHMTNWPLITPLGVIYLLFMASVIAFIVVRHRAAKEIERAKNRHPSRLGLYSTLEGEKK